MARPLFCVHDAKNEKLFPAVGVAGGMSTCQNHLSAPTEPLPLDAACAHCRATRHRAYFVVDDEPVCVRHAADGVFPDDDMGAHDMAHAVYIGLHAIGDADAY